MKKIYVDGSHDYDYGKKTELNGDTLHTLYRSDNHEWYEPKRGEAILSIIDDGNGLSIRTSVDNLDYAKALELRILIGIVMKDDYKTLQTVEDL